MDPERQEIVVVMPGAPNKLERERVVWLPAGTTTSLVVDVARVFDENSAAV